MREATSAAGPVRAALSRNSRSRSRIPSASLTGLRPSRGKLCDLRRIFASVRANSPAIREARFARRVGPVRVAHAS